MVGMERLSYRSERLTLVFYVFLAGRQHRNEKLEELTCEMLHSFSFSLQRESQLEHNHNAATHAITQSFMLQRVIFLSPCPASRVVAMSVIKVSRDENIALGGVHKLCPLMPALTPRRMCQSQLKFNDEHLINFSDLTHGHPHISPRELFNTSVSSEPRLSRQGRVLLHLLETPLEPIN